MTKNACPVRAVLTAMLLWTAGLCTDAKAQQQVTLTQVLRVGDEARGDTVVFGHILHAEANSKGQILVAEVTPPAVTLLSSEGVPLQQVGREGAGPGEYQEAPGFVIGQGDSVAVMARRRRRVAVFEPNSLELSYEVAPPDDGNHYAVRLIGATDAGFIVQYSHPWIGQGSNAENPVTKINLISRRGAKVRTVLELPTESYATVVFQGMQMARVLPYTRRAHAAIGPDARLYGGWNDAIDIQVMNLDGSLHRSIAASHDPVPVTRDDIDAAVAGISVAEVKQALLKADIPKTKAAYVGLIVSDTGRLWIRHSANTGAEHVEWTLLNADGSAYGTVMLPSELRLFSIRSGLAYGRVQDASGAQILVVYRIDRP